MAKKKSHKAKKRQFKATRPSTSAQGSMPVEQAAVSAASSNETARPVRAVAKAGDVSSDFSHVGEDVRLIGLLTAGFLILQLALWYLLEHTRFGPSVYNLIQL